jgi:4-amino-4-deoxy-L-arabinose transferase-like glycosyltransferase
MSMRRDPARKCTWSSAERAAAVALVVLTLAVRVVAVGLWIGWETPVTEEPASDGRIYATLAQSLAAGEGFRIQGVPTTSAPPLYPAFLAGVSQIAGSSPAVVRAVQVTMSGATTLAVLWALRSVFGHVVAWAAALAWSLHPVTVYVSGLTLTESLFSLLLAFWLVVGLAPTGRARLARAWGAGLVTGLAALTRAFFLGIAPFLAFWFAARAGGREAKAVAVLGLFGLAVAVGPWALRNYLVTGEFIPIQGNTGLMIWAGNNPYALGGMVMPSSATWREGAPPDGYDYGWQGLTNRESNARYLKAAWRWIREDPGAFAINVLWKLKRLFGFARAGVEDAPQVPPVAVVLHVTFLLLAGFGIAWGLPRWRELLPFYVLVAYQVVVVIIFSGGSRYLVSMAIPLAVFVGVAVEKGFALLGTLVLGRGGERVRGT